MYFQLHFQNTSCYISIGIDNIYFRTEAETIITILNCSDVVSGHTKNWSDTFSQWSDMGGGRHERMPHWVVTRADHPAQGSCFDIFFWNDHCYIYTLRHGCIPCYFNKVTLSSFFASWLELVYFTQKYTLLRQLLPIISVWQGVWAPVQRYRHHIRLMTWQ